MSNDVDSVQADSQAFIKTQFEEVKVFTDALKEFADTNEVDIPTDEIAEQYFSMADLAGMYNALDGFRPSESVPSPEPLGSVPGNPNTIGITPITPENIPDLSASPYTPAFPGTPSASLPSVPTAPGLITPSLPATPNVSLPAAPSFTSVAIPSSLGIEIPSFSYVVPTTDLTAPTERFVFNEVDYTSMLSDEIKAKLFFDMENGGYGIETVDERALWDRARERTSVEANSRIEDALRAAATRGFMLPPGADMAVVADAQQASLEKIASMDREIALKRADMYVENRKFSITAATQVEALFINYRSSMMERMLNAAKALVELGVAVFNAKKDKYMADLEAYKAYAAVFEAKIRAELSKIEIYKGQIEGARLQVEVQKGMADLYRTQVEASKNVIDIYRVQMEGVKALLEVERNKMDIFHTQMEGYSTTVQAKSAEFGLYSAQIQGEISKVASYEAQVRAFAARVEASKARIGAQAARTDAEKATNDAKIEVFRTQIEGYKANIDRVVREYGMRTEKYRSDVALFGTRSENASRQKDITFRASANNAALANIYVQRQIANLERSISALFKQQDFRLTAAKYGTDASAQLAVAAAQQITGLTTLLKTS
jgi:hypothetical protein